MDKVVHLSEIFKTIFYFKFLELGKGILGAVKVWSNLKSFELNRIWFLFLWIQIPPLVTVPGPHLAVHRLPYFRAARVLLPATPRRTTATLAPTPLPTPRRWVVPPADRPPPPHRARLKGRPITAAPPFPTPPNFLLRRPRERTPRFLSSASCLRRATGSPPPAPSSRRRAAISLLTVSLTPTFPFPSVG
jgi:hypothetical protein